MNRNVSDRYLRFVLIANGVGDIVLAVLMLLAPGLLSRLLGLRLTDDVVYVAGGWGTAAAASGALRVCAGTVARIEVAWFVAAFGIFEGVILTAFSLSVTGFTSLGLPNVGLSALFAAVFAVAYAIAFLLRRASSAKSGVEDPDGPRRKFPAGR